MISIDRFKPAYCDSDYPVKVESLSRRGRPLKIVHYDPQNQPNDTGSVNEHTSRSGRPLRQTELKLFTIKVKIVINKATGRGLVYLTLYINCSMT